ncbi:hypothetical protein DFH06DRAFT_323722 [Mycena polygramma]|nr:hypothetical protein DFH06DRAFT_323722 [Mycena polygramma]
MSTYTPLLHGGEYEEDEETSPKSVRFCECETHHKNRSPRHGTRMEQRALKLAICASIASLACAFMNISFVALRVADITNERKYMDTMLESPSAYFGLERAVHDPTAEPPHPISNFPLLAAQINRARPKDVYFEHNRHLTNFGTAYPLDRKVRVSPEISTVIQFRVQDWGMERCSLAFRSSVGKSQSGNHHERDMAEHWTGSVDVWRLDEGKRINGQSLSWNTRANRRDLMASWNLSTAEHLETGEFDCKSGSILTFELSCSSNDCQLEFIQTKEKPRAALLVIQRSSL